MKNEFSKELQDLTIKQLEVAYVLIKQKLSQSILQQNDIKILDIKIGNLKTRCTFFTEVEKEIKTRF